MAWWAPCVGWMTQRFSSKTFIDFVGSSQNYVIMCVVRSSFRVVFTVASSHLILIWQPFVTGPLTYRT